VRNRLKRFIPLIAVLLLAPWPIVYAQDYASAASKNDSIQIEVAEPSVMPSWQTFGGAIGGVDNPGDLFYINANDNPADILVTLHLTNTNELSCCYSYLILKVGVYVQDDTGEWKPASSNDGAPVPDIFITDRNGRVNFKLPGFAKYKVTIDSGSYYCFTTQTSNGGVSPQFYLTADPA
jgi:hypothetical protein